jgi:hypothetical protein
MGAWGWGNAFVKLLHVRDVGKKYTQPFHVSSSQPLSSSCKHGFYFPFFFFSPLPFVFFGQQHGLSVQPLVLALFNL